MRKILVAAICSLLIFGCTEAKVTASDLTGTWGMNEDSRQYLSASAQKATARLILKEDGTFVASQIPGGLLYFPSEGHPPLVTGGGVWKVSDHGEGQQLQLEFRTVADAKTSEVPFGTQMFILGSGADTQIFYYQGDPDEGVRIKFQKLSDGKKKEIRN